MKRIHTLLAGALLVAAALPARAGQPRILNMSPNYGTTGTCPNRTLNATGTISWLLGGTISYYLQGDDGRKSGQVTVTLPDGGNPVPFNLSVPIPATAGSAQIVLIGALAPVPVYKVPYNACPAVGSVTGFTLNSTDVSGHCSSGNIVLHTSVITAGGPITVTYAPVLNGMRGSGATASFTSAGSHALDITVNTLTPSNGSAQAALTAPVSLSTSSVAFTGCAQKTPTTGKGNTHQ